MSGPSAVNFSASMGCTPLALSPLTVFLMFATVNVLKLSMVIRWLVVPQLPSPQMYTAGLLSSAIPAVRA